MQKIKILTACHKPYDVVKNEVYTPIHVGRAISKFKEEMADMMGDDTGDNISEKNPLYSEMTAQYWAWKNIRDTEYIGFCHYRRGFEIRFNEQNVQGLFNDGTDVILAGPILREKGRYDFLKNYVCLEDLTIMLYVIKKLYPEYYKTVSNYAYGNLDYPLNMLVCKKVLFDQYAKWIFDILFECEKYIKSSPYSRARRVYGYLSEFLMPVYFIHHGLKIKPMRYTIENGQLRGGIKKSALMKMKMINWIYWRHKKYPLLYSDYSVIAGLKADNILDFDSI